MKNPHATTRNISFGRCSLPVIILASLLTVSSTYRIPDQAVVERVSLESTVDGSGTLIRVHANREIPWFTLSAEEGSEEFRLTLLNTRLDPKAVLADASGSVRSFKIYEQGSRVFLEAVLVSSNLFVSLQADPSSFDLLLTISTGEGRPAAAEPSLPADVTAAAVAVPITVETPDAVAPPAPTATERDQTATVIDALEANSRRDTANMATVRTDTQRTEATQSDTTQTETTQSVATRIETVQTETLPTDSSLPGYSQPSKAAPKETQAADAEHSLSDVQRLFSSTLKKSTVVHVPNADVVQSNTDRWRLDTVVLDAGHGGWDEGAFGKAGFLEKDLALIIALRVGRMIEEQLGVKVVYTRSDDRFIPVAERGKLANEAGGKLFVSIHANYSANRQAHGTETYFLGVHRSDSAKVVMERENRVVQLEDDTRHYSQYDNAASARGALAQSSFMRHSAWLAEAVQQQFTDVVKRRDRGVKQAGFYVLFGASMPSILIELGFLSNPIEEKFLSSNDGQTSMANAIFRAIQNFKLEYEKSLPVASE